MPASNAEMAPYWKALGQFVTEFAGIEATLQIVLWHFARVDFNIARAIFSGVKIDQGISFINRINQSIPLEKTVLDEFEFVFTQLRAITSVRNDILHYGARNTGENKLSVSNALFALTPAHIKETVVSPKMLMDMTTDLKKISAHLVKIKFSTFRPVPKSVIEILAPFLTSSWLYKPPAQGQTRQSKSSPTKTRKKHQRQ